MIIIDSLYEIKPTQFPDGTTQVWKLPEEVVAQIVAIKEPYKCYIDWSYEGDHEIMTLAQTKMLIDGLDKPCRLYVEYLPYARQDKLVDNYSTFALRTFAQLINAMNFDKVTCMDAHSDIAGKLINNFSSLCPHEYIADAIDDCSPAALFFPDSGASSRYGHLFGIPSFHGTKIRNQFTGEIVDYHVNKSPSLKSVLIIDDICDGGATFIKAAQALKANGVEKCYLYVTHGIFSKGLDELKRYFTKIYAGQERVDNR